jgi:hypothetical protein
MRGGALRATWRPPSPRPVVAPQVWCKSHGRRLGLMMQRGSCERPVYHLPLCACCRRPEQIVAQVLKLADELGTISTPRQPHEAWSRPAKTSGRQDCSPGSRPITFFGTVRLRTRCRRGLTQDRPVSPWPTHSSAPPRTDGVRERFPPRGPRPYGCDLPSGGGGRVTPRD